MSHNFSQLLLRLDCVKKMHDSDDAPHNTQDDAQQQQFCFIFMRTTD